MKKKKKSDDTIDLVAFSEFFKKETEKLLKKPMDRFAEEEEIGRDKYQENISNVLTGGAFEFFKCLVHDRLKLHDADREHWEKEWRYHLGGKLFDALRRKTKFSNKIKAAEEILAYFLNNNITGQMTAAANTIYSYHKGVIPSRDCHLALTKKDVDLFEVAVNEGLDRFKNDFYPQYKKEMKELKKEFKNKK